MATENATGRLPLLVRGRTSTTKWQLRPRDDRIREVSTERRRALRVRRRSLAALRGSGASVPRRMREL